MDRRVTGGRFVAGVVAVAALVLSGCGVPAQDQPDVVNRHDVPFGLAQEGSHPPPVSTTIPVTPDTHRKS